MKKILFFSHCPTEQGLDDANQILLLAAKSLPADTYQTVVMTPSYGYLNRRLSREKIPTQIIDYDCDYYNRMIFHAKDQHNLEEICTRLEDSLRQSRLYQFFQEWQPDLVYANTASATPAAILGKLVNAKVIWHLHDIIDNFLPRIDQQNLIQIIDRYADKLIVVGQGVQQSLSELGQSAKCELIYHGLEGSNRSLEELAEQRQQIRAQRVPHADTPLIGYLGQITPVKGVHHFVRAANIVLQQIPGAKFTIIGDPRTDPDYSDQLHHLIKQLGREQEIQFWGYCQDLDQALPGLDCLVVPSTYDDPLPTVLIEGNLYHLPVIGYKRGGINEIIAHQINGLLVEKDQIQELANAIFEVIEDPQRQWLMGELGYRRASYRFNYSRFERNIRQIVAEVIQGIYQTNPCRDGRLVKGSGNAIYLLENGSKRRILDLQMFKEMGFDWTDVQELTDVQLTQIPDGSPYSLPYWQHHYGFLPVQENCTLVDDSVSDPIDQILQHWDLSYPESEDCTLKNPTCWVATATGDSYLLKRKGDVGDQTQPKLIQREYHLLTYLAHTDLPVSLPLLTTTGTFFVEQNDSYYCLYPGLPGQPIPDQDSLPKAIQPLTDLGQTLAHLHQVLQSYEYRQNFERLDLLMTTFGPVQSQLITRCADQKQQWLIRLIYHLQTDITPVYLHLPEQLIHRNLHCGNILFDKNQVSGLLDFAHVAKGIRLYDLCYAAIGYLPYQLEPAALEEWIELIGALLEGYQSVTPLLQVEKQVFGTVLQMAFLNVIDHHYRTGNEKLAQHYLSGLFWIDGREELLQNDLFQ